jgi:methylated-DNA-protein-cysteine methyltransferase related protein
VATYGQAAAWAGLPRRARLVSHALRIRPDNVHIQWYRVVNAKGRLSFPPGSMPYNQQRSCLEAEGVFLSIGAST